MANLISSKGSFVYSLWFLIILLLFHIYQLHSSNIQRHCNVRIHFPINFIIFYRDFDKTYIKRKMKNKTQSIFVLSLFCVNAIIWHYESVSSIHSHAAFSMFPIVISLPLLKVSNFVFNISSLHAVLVCEYLLFVWELHVRWIMFQSILNHICNVTLRWLKNKIVLNEKNVSNHTSHCFEKGNASNDVIMCIQEIANNIPQISLCVHVSKVSVLNGCMVWWRCNRSSIFTRLLRKNKIVSGTARSKKIVNFNENITKKYPQIVLKRCLSIQLNCIG